MSHAGQIRDSEVKAFVESQFKTIVDDLYPGDRPIFSYHFKLTRPYVIAISGPTHLTTEFLTALDTKIVGLADFDLTVTDDDQVFICFQAPPHDPQLDRLPFGSFDDKHAFFSTHLAVKECHVRSMISGTRYDMKIDVEKNSLIPRLVLHELLTHRLVRFVRVYGRNLQFVVIHDNERRVSFRNGHEDKNPSLHRRRNPTRARSDTPPRSRSHSRSRSRSRSPQTRGAEKPRRPPVISGIARAASAFL